MNKDQALRGLIDAAAEAIVYFAERADADLDNGGRWRGNEEMHFQILLEDAIETLLRTNDIPESWRKGRASPTPAKSTACRAPRPIEGKEE